MCPGVWLPKGDQEGMAGSEAIDLYTLSCGSFRKAAGNLIETAQRKSQDIQLNGKIIELVAKSPVNCSLVIPKPLCVASRCFPLAPGLRRFNPGNAVDDERKRSSVSVISHLPVKHVFDLRIRHTGDDLRHNVRADITAITH